MFPRIWSERDVTELKLPELRQRAAEALVRAALGQDVPAVTVARVVEQAGGNPFYLEELIRAVAEERGEALPETVLAMVQARLGRLLPGTRAVLRAASVFGEFFWKGGLVALLRGARRGVSAGASGAVLAALRRVEATVEARQMASASGGPRPSPTSAAEMSYRFDILDGSRIFYEACVGCWSREFHAEVHRRPQAGRGAAARAAVEPRGQPRWLAAHGTGAAELIIDLLRWAIAEQLARTAFVLSNPTSRLQARRIIESSVLDVILELFVTEGEALAWLRQHGV
ncbi:hypothetical protein [Sorangium sp. So ce1099]|uniref:hypothetical protein n=1 Tax=Sorangium sp. So ce1099 TaxID=3133331 RepID=UPI003F5F982B